MDDAGELSEVMEKIAEQDPHCKFEKNLILQMKPNNGVSAEITVSSSSHLTVRIIFDNTKEIVEIIDTAYGQFTIEEKIKRLQNIIAHIKRSDKKEQLLPGCSNWQNYRK